MSRFSVENQDSRKQNEQTKDEKSQKKKKLMLRD